MSRKAAARTRPNAVARRDESLGMYRVIAAPMGGGYRGAAYAGMRRVEMAEGEDLDAAFEAAAQRLRERLAAHRAARVDGWPAAAEYRDAIEAAPLRGSARLTAMLEAHVRRPEACATWAELAAAAGVDPADARLEYARLGRKLAKALGLPLDADLGRELAPVSAFAVVEALGAGSTVRLRPQVAEALKDL